MDSLKFYFFYGFIEYFFHAEYYGGIIKKYY